MADRRAKASAADGFAPPDSNRAAVAGVLAVLLSLVLLAGQIALAARSLANYRLVQEDNIVWIAASLQRDVLLFEVELRRSLTAESDRAPSLAPTIRSFDLYYSRLQVVGAVVSRIGADLPNPELSRARLERLRAHADAMADAIDSRGLSEITLRRQFAAELWQDVSDARALANDILMYSTDLAARQRQASENGVGWLVALTLALTAQLVAMAFVYRRLYTHARRREALAAASLVMLRKAAEASSEAIVITGATGRVLQVNPAAAQLIGQAAEGLVGRSVADFLHAPPEDKVGLVSGLDTLSRIGKMTARLRLSEGPRRPVTIETVAEAGSNGLPIFIFFLRDLTEELARRAEARQRRRLAVQEAQRRNGFLAAVTHDLRTPLQIVTGALELIEDEELSAAARDHLDMARSAATVAIAKVEDTIAAALPDSRTQGPVAAETLSPLPLLRSVLQSTGASAEARGWRFDLLAADPSPVRAIPQHLAQAFGRMLELALLAGTEAGGPGLVRVALEPDGASLLRLRVARPDLIDSAPSRRTAEAPDPARTAERRRNARQQARLAAEAMGCHLLGDPGSRRGATLALPLALPSAQPLSAPAGTPAGRGPQQAPRAPGAAARPDRAPSGQSPAAQAQPARRCILVADDSPQAAHVVAQALRRMGHDVRETHSATEAVALAALIAFDTLILDVQMPGMDGIEAAGHIRRGGASAKARLVLLSANMLPEDLPRIAALDVARVLAKPARAGELADALEAAPGAPAALPRPQPAAATAKPPLPEALAFLNDSLGPAGVRRLVVGFVAELDEVSSARQAQLPAPDLAHLVHRAAGTAAILGLGDLHAASCAYELALRQPGQPHATAQAASAAAAAAAAEWQRSADAARDQLLRAI